MAKKVLVALAILVVTAGVAGGVWWWNSANQKRQAQTAALAWTVVVEKRDLSETIDGTGTVALGRNGDLYPAYEATVQQINCRVGEKVKKGAVLMVLEAPTLREQWAEAEANVNKARVNLAQAEKELTRVKELFDAQGATVDEVEAAQKQVDLYREELKLAEFKLNELQGRLNEANYLSSDHRQLWIRAPFDGEIAWVNVKPGDKVTTQTLLLSLADLRTLEIEISVDESEIGQVKPGQKAVIFLNDTKETKLNGVVSRVGKVGREESGVVVFPVVIQIERGSGQLRPGMSADVTIYASTTGEVLAIPADAVVEREGQAFVRLWASPQPKWVPVKLGVRSGSYVEVVEGLKEGDRVVVMRRSGAWNGTPQGIPGGPADRPGNGPSRTDNPARMMGLGSFGGRH